MDKDGIDRCLTRIAYEILEKNKGMENLVLVGIRTGGVYLAQRLQKKYPALKAEKFLWGYWMSIFTAMIFPHPTRNSLWGKQK